MLAQELKLPYDIARLLALRGYTNVDDAKVFLRPRLTYLHDALGMGGLGAAVERLASAIAKRELVMVHGDYDVDGICSTTLLVRTIRGLGGKAIPFIPHRLTDGYDLGPAGVAAAIRAHAAIVVTCDCGTSAVQPIADLNAAGIDVIVSDHHLPGGALPESLAILNPRRPGCEYPDKDLAAVGVAFKLSLALAKATGKPDAFIWKMLDLVALATVADIAPLRGENRVFVRYGLRMMSETENLGLRALIRASGLEGKPLTAGRVGYILAPRLNAVGRLDSALRGVQLLLSETPSEANAIARELEELNKKRQELDRTTLDEARALVHALPLDDTYGIALARQGWHPGVIGIVASRLVEEFGRPTILIGLDGDTGKGSGRSITPFNLHASLTECRDLLLRFGGHRAAAGVTIHTSQVEPFAQRFNEIARRELTQDDLMPELRVDAELDLSEATDELETLLRHFEPFGIGNPSPVFASRNVRLAAPPRVVGRNALKLHVATPHGPLEAIGWNMGDYAPLLTETASFDMAFRLERDEYRGESRLQAKLADIVIR
jgi:single-stranded-DNA-specific exonuclease